MVVNFRRVRLACLLVVLRGSSSVPAAALDLSIKIVHGDVSRLREVAKEGHIITCCIRVSYVKRSIAAVQLVSECLTCFGC